MGTHNPPFRSTSKILGFKKVSKVLSVTLFLLGSVSVSKGLESALPLGFELPSTTPRDELNPTLAHVLGLDTLGSFKDQFGREDLVDLVKELEQETTDEEQSAKILPEIMQDFLEGALLSGQTEQESTTTTATASKNDSEVIRPPEYFFMSQKQDDEEEEGMDDSDELETEDEDEEPGISLLDDTEDEGNLPEDLADLPEDIDEDINAGVEESLRLYGQSSYLTFIFRITAWLYLPTVNLLIDPYSLVTKQ